MNPRARRLRRQRRKDRAIPYRNDPVGPYVCPGCYAVGGELCAPDCIDLELRRGDVYDGTEDDPFYDEDSLETYEETWGFRANLGDYYGAQ